MKATVAKRTLTGVGFFTDFDIADKKLTLGDDVKFQLGGIHADLYGLKHGADFILYIKDGLMETLEGYCYDEKWPDNERIKKLYVVQKDGLLIAL